MADHRYFIGLMSGTSADAIDAVLVSFTDDEVSVVAEHSRAISADIRQQISQLCTPDDDGLDLLGLLDISLGKLFADAALTLLEVSGLTASDISAIGSHGQTVRHRPPCTPGQQGFTLQIGDPSTIAARTGITTVADFRRKDMALGGQGAPLAPGFHQQVFASPTHNRAVVNLGGIANLTWLPIDGSVLGFDTGPSNTLLDYWCFKHTGNPFDDQGDWGSKGQINPTLLAALLSHPYLSRDIPKSTGREEFSPEWLETLLGNFSDVKPVDIQATLTQFTIESLVLGLKKLPMTADEIYLCGGGTFNLQLIKRLQETLPGIPVMPTSALGIPPMQVEGATFAWLAKQTLDRLPGALPSVTGATQAAVLGGIYFP